MPRKLHPSSKINCQVITSIKEREQSIDGEAAIFTSHRWNCKVGVGRNGTRKPSNTLEGTYKQVLRGCMFTKLRLFNFEISNVKVQRACRM